MRAHADQKDLEAEPAEPAEPGEEALTAPPRTAGQRGFLRARLATSSPAATEWRRAFIYGASVWAAATSAYFLINCLVWMVRSEAGPRLSGMLEVWNRWDTGHYVGIAVHGYNPDSQNPAFFPLYPLLIRWLEPVLPGGALSAGLIISHAACIVALATLFRLTEDLHGEAMARRTVLYLMAYPFAFYLVAAYNESLFLALSLGSLYCMRRGRWWHAGALGALASATRLAGLLLALAFLFEYARQHEWRLRAFRVDLCAAAFVPVGAALYAVFCARAFGDPLKFIHIQATWGRKLSWPWEGAQTALAVSIDASRDGAIFQPLVVLNAIDGLALFASLALMMVSAIGPWRLGRESAYLTLFAFGSLMLIVPSPLGMTVPLHGAPRYVLELIPVFMILGRMGANAHVDRFYTTIAFSVQGVLLLTYFFGVWLS